MCIQARVRQRAGARVGGAVRAEVLRVPAGPRLPRRDRGDLQHAARAARPKRLWVLDADLAAAFDRIDHDHLLAALGTFPRQGTDRAVAEGGSDRERRFAPTEEGTPQGGVISPVAAERRLARDGDRPPGSATTAPARSGRQTVPGSPGAGAGTPTTWSRSATAVSRPNRSRHGWPSGWRPGGWPSTRTRRASSTSTEGFDFLGFNVRRYRTASC